MKLAKLIENFPVKVYGKIKNIIIQGLSDDSRTVGPGYVFFAKKGEIFDGNDFIEAAINNGAVAIVSSFFNPLFSNIVQIIGNVDEIEEFLAVRFYGDPSKLLNVVGITGTNGKTTVAYLIHHILENRSIKTGLLGTIEYIVGKNTLPSELTTPKLLTNQKLMKEMIRHGCHAVSMEVTSIGLIKKRVDKIHFKTAIFTNLSQDHLDVHGSFENYCEAKSRLFSLLSKNSLAIVNADSEWLKFLLKDCLAPVKSYGLSPKADVRASDIKLNFDCTSFNVTYLNETEKIYVSLIGRHNVYNILAGIAFGLFSLNATLKEIASIVSCFKSPLGRLELVEKEKTRVFIDYAHTPDALENVLSTLKEVLHRKGKLIIVFGCGGNRDKGKRKLMAQVSEKYGTSILTSDNPRTENPIEIINDILKGFSQRNYFIEEDRKTAIEFALKQANEKDIVLIAGKGHENYQKRNHMTIPFSDKEVVKNFFRNCETNLRG